MPTEAQKTYTAAEYEALKARVAELEAAKTANNKLACKVAKSGGMSVYGLGRYPVTLYHDSWVRLLAFAPEITAFLEKHKAEFSTKPSNFEAAKPEVKGN